MLIEDIRILSSHVVTATAGWGDKEIWGALEPRHPPQLRALPLLIRRPVRAGRPPLFGVADPARGHCPGLMS